MSGYLLVVTSLLLASVPVGIPIKWPPLQNSPAPCPVKISSRLRVFGAELHSQDSRPRSKAGPAWVLVIKWAGRIFGSDPRRVVHVAKSPGLHRVLRGIYAAMGFGNALPLHATRRCVPALRFL